MNSGQGCQSNNIRSPRYVQVFIATSVVSSHCCQACSFVFPHSRTTRSYIAYTRSTLLSKIANHHQVVLVELLYTPSEQTSTYLVCFVELNAKASHGHYAVSWLSILVCSEGSNLGYELPLHRNWHSHIV